MPNFVSPRPPTKHGAPFRHVLGGGERRLVGGSVERGSAPPLRCAAWWRPSPRGSPRGGALYLRVGGGTGAHHGRFCSFSFFLKPIDNEGFMVYNGITVSRKTTLQARDQKHRTFESRVRFVSCRRLSIFVV